MTPDLEPIRFALETIAVILTEPDVVALRGEAYTDDELDRISEGIEAFNKLDPNPRTPVTRLLNQGKLNQAGRAIDLAEVLLNRVGFLACKDSAWTDHDKEVIEAGMAAFDRATAWQRG